MNLKEFYETYKLHRKHSIGNPIPENHPSYIKDEFTRKYSSGADSYEEHVGKYIGIIEKNLYIDLMLCFEVFKSFDIDFFFWFTTEFYKWFEDILKKHKSLELLEVLKEHVYSFDDSIATERMNEIYNNSINYCKWLSILWRRSSPSFC